LVARGEVWWYEDPRVGRRPFLILSRSEAVPVLHQILAAPATRTRRGIPTEVDLDRSDGMPDPCVISLDNVTLVRPALCIELLTRLGPERMAEVCTALRTAVAC
jgi:mRNA interferase MazF